MEIPTVRGLHLCEQAIIEEGSRNVSLVNIFNRIAWYGPDVPLRCVLYGTLCGTVGATTLELTITDLSTGEAAFSRALPFTFLDAIASHRIIYRFLDLKIPEPIPHEVTISSQGERVAVTRFELFVKE